MNFVYYRRSPLLYCQYSLNKKHDVHIRDNYFKEFCFIKDRCLKHVVLKFNKMRDPLAREAKVLITTTRQQDA